MPLIEQELEGTRVARLSGNIDIRSAHDLRREFTQLAASGEAAIVDCSAVDALDTSILQLLVALKIAASQRIRFECDPGSEAAKWIELAGLTQNLFPEKSSAWSHVPEQDGMSERSSSHSTDADEIHRLK